MLETLFDGYEMTFVLEAPQPIQDSTLGLLSAGQEDSHVHGEDPGRHDRRPRTS